MYEEIIQKFKEKYSFADFFQERYSSGEMILRHDIDFCLESAYEMAVIEKKAGIRANYFFMTNSSAYNIFDKEFLNLVNFIAENHNVGLHFNPDTEYESIESLHEKQLQILSLRFPGRKLFTSVHRPTKAVLNNPHLAFGHSYHPDYFTKISYFSDSRCDKNLHGLFDSHEYQNNFPMQVLIHPIWWMNFGVSIEGNLNIIKLRKKNEFERYINSNIRL